ncbi:MAG TPA: site-2 protease family protein [Candidatus Nanoarchaeia archaeon]|nr:site-2 protease family protein [Candidatus Nanoarchaeia archaeon]
MNFDLLFAVLFYGLLIWFFFKKREKWEVHGKIIALYKTQLGVKAMEKLASKFPTLLKFLSGISLTVGFIGMGLIFYYLIIGTYTLITIPKAIPAVAPVLPGVKIPGLPVLSFWHWIIAIFIVAVVHEFSHGIYSRLYKIPLKSSGLALFGPILGAFVEPDEKLLKKQSRFRQITIFSAGSFSNIILAIIAILLLQWGAAPLYSNFYETTGIQVNSLLPGHAAEAAGIKAPVIITSINSMPATTAAEFFNATKDIRARDPVTIETSQGTFTLLAEEHPQNATKGFIGIADFEMQTSIKPEKKEKYGTFIPSSVAWLHMLLFWVFIVSFGIGLFNLLPLGPIDGGRMFYTALGYFIKKESMQKRIFGAVTLFCLLLILINLFPYIWKLFVWIGKLFVIGS